MTTTITSGKIATTGERPTRKGNPIIYASGRAARLNGTNARVSCGDVSNSKNIKTIVFHVRFPNTVTATLERIIDTGNGGIAGSNAGIADTISGTWRTYINALEQTYVGQSDWFVVHMTNAVGVDANAVFLANEGANYGEVDLCNVQFWNALFTEQDIANTTAFPERLATSFNSCAFALTTTTLRAWYPMIEGSGNDIFDYSGNATDGTAANHTWLTGLENVPQTMLMGLCTTAGVLRREDPTDGSVDIAGNALDLLPGGFNCLGDGQFRQGDIGSIRSATVVIMPDSTTENIMDYDDGVHALGLVAGVATDWSVLAEDGSTVFCTDTGVAEDGSFITISEQGMTEAGTLTPVGWVAETITVNGVESVTVVANKKHVIGISSATAFDATAVENFIAYQGKIYRHLTYSDEHTEARTIRNYRALI
jgi:hypothetical protein